jgi:hypothetical protein
MEKKVELKTKRQIYKKDYDAKRKSSKKNKIGKFVKDPFKKKITQAVLALSQNSL